MRKPAGSVPCNRLLAIAFDPAVAGEGFAPGRAETNRRLEAAMVALDSSTTMLAQLGHSEAPARIKTLTRRYHVFAERLSTLVAIGASSQAALELGKSQRPGGVQAMLNAEFDKADLDYGLESGTVAEGGHRRDGRRDPGAPGRVLDPVPSLRASQTTQRPQRDDRRVDRYWLGQPPQAVRRDGPEDRHDRRGANRDR